MRWNTSCLRAMKAILCGLGTRHVVWMGIGLMVGLGPASDAHSARRPDPISPLSHEESWEFAVSCSDVAFVGEVIGRGTIEVEVQPNASITETYIDFRPTTWIKGAERPQQLRIMLPPHTPLPLPLRVLPSPGGSSFVCFARSRSPGPPRGDYLELNVAGTIPSGGLVSLEGTTADSLILGLWQIALEQSTDSLAIKADLILIGTGFDSLVACGSERPHRSCEVVKVDRVIAGTWPAPTLTVSSRLIRPIAQDPIFCT